MLLWLESTGIAQWVGLSLYAYPSLLALHITGLAVVVGILPLWWRTSLSGTLLGTAACMMN